MSLNAARKLIGFLWLLLSSLSVLGISIGALAAFTMPMHRNAVTYIYDGQSQRKLACDRRRESGAGYDAAVVLAASDEENGAVADYAFFAKSADFLAAEGAVANPVPGTLARVIPNGINATTLGAPGAVDVFVADASQLEGLNAQQIAAKLAIPESPTGFQVIQFSTPESGLASPVFRSNPGFIGGGQTAGGASEFVIPNGPIPAGATTTIVH